MVRVTSAVGLVTVQDAGRRGFMHLGVPPGGALVPEALARANAAVGNAAGAAALEIVGRIGVSSDTATVGTDEGVCHTLSPGEPFEIASTSAVRVRYLAIAGGIDVPVVLGGRGTLLVARLGGLEGRVLRRGDVLATGDAAEAPRARAIRSPPPPTPATLRIVPGPDDDPLALATLLATAFRIGTASDRVGARLTGGHVHTALTVARSRPMVRGAIQLPPSGEPIVLGPDHPTTGGYPVVAVVLASDVGRIYARGPGAEVGFVRGEP